MPTSSSSEAGPSRSASSNPPPSPSFFPTPALDHAFGGITAGAVATVCMNPLDLIKTQFQINTSTPPVAPTIANRSRLLHTLTGGKIIRDMYNALSSVVQSEGWRGLYRGLSPNVVGNSASWGLYFLWYTMIKEHMSASGDGSNKLTAGQHLLAASESGAVTALITNPIWVVKTRMFMDKDAGNIAKGGASSSAASSSPSPSPYRSLTSSLAHIYKTEGIRGLYRGAGLALFGVSNGAIQFMAYEQLKRYRSDVALRKLGGNVSPEDLGSEGQVKLVSDQPPLSQTTHTCAHAVLTFLFSLSRQTTNTSSSQDQQNYSPSYSPTHTKLSAHESKTPQTSTRLPSHAAFPSRLEMKACAGSTKV